MSCADIVVLTLNILTLSVAIVTLVSTKRQFEKNMKEQEKAINISLFDLRTEILSALRRQDRHFDRARAKLLFNSEINDMIDQLDILYKEKRDLEWDEKKYHRYDALQMDYSREEIEQFFSDIEEIRYTYPEDQSYDALVNRIEKIRVITHLPISEHEDEQIELPSYLEVLDQINEREQKIGAAYKDLACTMESFIKESISYEQKKGDAPCPISTLLHRQVKIR